MKTTHKHFNYQSIIKCVHICIISLILFSDNSNGDDVSVNQSKNNVSVSLAANVIDSDFELHVLLLNKTSASIKTSNIGTMGNAFHVITPSGEKGTYAVEDKLLKGFTYVPDVVLDKESSEIFTSKDSFLSYFHFSIAKFSDPGKYELWFDVVDHIDFRAAKSHKYTSNKLLMYVGKDGKKTFMNDAETVKAFQKHGIEVSNSADKVEFEKTAEGNYQVHKITTGSRDKVAAEKESERHYVLAWIVGGIFVLGLGYFIWKRSNQRIEG